MKLINLLFKDRSLGYKFLVLPGIPVIIAVLVISADVLTSQKEMLVTKAKKRASLLKELSLLTVSNDFILYNKRMIDNIVDNLGRNSSVAYATIVDSSDNRILAHSNHSWDGKIFTQNATPALKDVEAYEISGDIDISGKKYGILKIGFSFKDVYQENAFIKQRFLIIAFIALSLGAIFSFILSRMVGAPIKALVEQARIIGAGNFENEIVYQSKDILGQLVNEFNKMATALKTKQQELINSEARFRHLAENMPVMMDALDEDFNIIVWNRECEEVTGYTADEIIGNPDSIEMLYPDDAYREKMFSELAEYGYYFRNKEYKLTRKDGTERTISWSNISSKVPVSGWHTWAIGVDVTERRRAQEGLSESEARLSQIITGSPVPTFVVDNNHVTTHWNVALEKLTEISGDNIIGTRSQWKAFYSEKRPVMADLIVKSVSEIEISKYYDGKCKKTENIENAYEAEDFFPDLGKEGKWLFFTAAPLRNSAGETIGAVETLQDTTARKKAEQALRESEEKYRLLVEFASDAIFIAQDDRVKFPNPKTLELVGYSEEELAQTPFGNLIHPEDRNMVYDRYYRALEGKGLPDAYTFRVLNKKGEYLDAYINATPIIWEGRSATLNLARDITAQKKIEEKLRQSQKMEAIGTLAGGIAHDFNNILSGIIGYAQLLQMKIQQDSDLQVYVDALLKAGDRAKNLVNQILAFSRQSTVEYRPVEIQLIVREALKLLGSTLPSTITIHQNIQNDCGLVLADNTQIHQILMNLCTNAYHSMEGTGGELSVDLKEVEYTAGAERVTEGNMNTGKYALLVIADTGTGIDTDIVPLIFDPYFTTKEKSKGTGLGLAVIHGIVKSYGGYITVDSEIGKGTTFNIHFPIIETLSATSDTKTAQPIKKGNERILLIDDQKDVLEIEQQMLEALGYQVTPITSSIEALRTFSEHPDGFDLVITDMTMPNMTGETLAGEIKKIRPNISILLCTGFSEGLSEERAADIGIKGFLMKPIALDELSYKVRDLLCSE